MKIEVDPSNVIEKKADDRGRVTLGMGLAEKTVTVAILDVDDSKAGFICANCGAREPIEEYIFSGGCPMCGEGARTAGIPEWILEASYIDELFEDDEPCPECGMGPRGIEDGVCQNCGTENISKEDTA